MDLSGQTLKSYLSEGETQGAINNKTFRLLGYAKDQLYEIELVRSKLEHEEPVF